MTEIKEYLLTKEEEEACADLIKKLREKKVFVIDFSGSVRVKAKTYEEACDIFWNWVEDLQNTSLTDWFETIPHSPHFEKESVEGE